MACVPQLGLIRLVFWFRSFGHKALGWLESKWLLSANAGAYYYQMLPKACSKEPPLGWSSLLCLLCHSQNASPWTLFGRNGVLDMKQPPKDPPTARGPWGRWCPLTHLRSTTWLMWNLFHTNLQSCVSSLQNFNGRAIFEGIRSQMEAPLFLFRLPSSVSRSSIVIRRTGMHMLTRKIWVCWNGALCKVHPLW